MDSAKYIPLPVQLNLQKDANTPPNPDVLTFTQYISAVRLQIRSAKEIHDLLLDCSNRLSDPASIPLIPLPMLSQQSTQQQSQQNPQQQPTVPT